MPETVAEEVKTAWTISMGDGYYFSIVPAQGFGWDSTTSEDQLVNGTFQTRLDAVEEVIAGFEQARTSLAKQLARAKRMRRRLISQAGAA